MTRNILAIGFAKPKARYTVNDKIVPFIKSYDVKLILSYIGNRNF